MSGAGETHRFGRALSDDEELQDGTVIEGERTRLLKACKASDWDRLYLLASLALSTGGRLSELMNLTWGDLDLKKAIAKVTETKNGTPRYLPIIPPVLEQIQSLPRPIDKKAYLFPSPKDPDKSFYSGFRKYWDEALEAAEIENFRFHDLRHSAASYLTEAGVPLVTVAEILGHKTMAMVQRRKGTLLSVMDMTMTAMGSRMLKQWVRYPLKDPTQIIPRYDAIDESRKQYQSTCEMRDHLNRVYDIERLRSKISMGHANARDLLSLKQSLQNLPAISRLLTNFRSPLFELSFDQQSLESIALHIEQAIREDAPPTLHEGGIVREGFDPALDELIQITRDGKRWLVNLEKQEKERTGITALKVRYNKVFGYYLEIPKTRLNSVPAHYIRKQTLVNAERYITEELKTFEDKVMGAEDKRAEMEFDILNTIIALVIDKNDVLEAAGLFLARLDCLLTLAIVSLENNYTRPVINTEGLLHIQDGRHPVIEKMITGERFVPNTLSMDNDRNQVLIITGPNMAGKSTVLRQVALTVLMAQMGSFVPAKEASISVTDRIFTRVGALDNLSQGQSTFLVEMQETANILNNASRESLVIMDEIGRGTSTFDGLSIAWAVAEFLHDINGIGVKTLFATHYHELTALSKEKERVKNFNITVKEWNDEIIFLRKLVEGGTNRSYGIQVARLAGIPETVIQRATRILADIENKNPTLPSMQNQGQPSRGRQPLQVQLELFKGHGDIVIQEIQALDTARMTPLDALNFLHSLQDKIKLRPFEHDGGTPDKRN